MSAADDEAKAFCRLGAQLGEIALLPALRIEMQGLDHIQRAQIYAGLLGALLGFMSSDLGPDDAEVFFHGFDNAFEEARRMREQIAKGLN